MTEETHPRLRCSTFAYSTIRGRQTAAEQTVRQTVLACATRYAKI